MKIPALVDCDEETPLRASDIGKERKGESESDWQKLPKKKKKKNNAAAAAAGGGNVSRRFQTKQVAV